MTDSPHDSNSDPPSQPERSTEQQEFGYAKPPKHSQFPKGKSGNPGGRPKNDLAREIAQGVFEEEPELIRQAFRKALQKGNAYVFKELGDRAYGKVKETVEVVATVRMLSDEELAKKLAEIAAIETSAT